MNDKFNQFYNQFNGKVVEVEDPSAYAQCMDLMFAWCDFINIPRGAVRHPTAIQVWSNADDTTRKYFDLIPNSPVNIPQVGDIIVFGTRVGPVGHVSIETGRSNYLNLTTFDQNWSGAGYARTVTHYLYSGVIGWLHPKVAQGDDTKVNLIKAEIDSSDSPQIKISKIKTIIG